MRISHVLAAGLVLGAVTGPLAAQERKTIPGPDVAIYNLAGIMKLEAGSGADVAVEIARGGRDGGKLTVATGEIRGRQTLRVIYPEDDISGLPDCQPGKPNRIRSAFLTGVMCP